MNAAAMEPLLISSAMLILTIAGDYFVKTASLPHFNRSWSFLLLGGLLYGLSALGWCRVYQSTKVFTVGAIHSFGVIFLSIFLSVVIFREKLSMTEGVGILLGIISLAILLKGGSA